MNCKHNKNKQKLLIQRRNHFIKVKFHYTNLSQNSKSLLSFSVSGNTLSPNTLLVASLSFAKRLIRYLLSHIFSINTGAKCIKMHRFASYISKISGGQTPMLGRGYDAPPQTPPSQSSVTRFAPRSVPSEPPSSARALRPPLLILQFNHCLLQVITIST